MSATDRKQKMMNLRSENDRLEQHNYSLISINAELLENMLNARMDADRLADELKIVLLTTGAERTGEDSPALLQHYQLTGEV